MPEIQLSDRVRDRCGDERRYQQHGHGEHQDRSHPVRQRGIGDQELQQLVGQRQEQPDADQQREVAAQDAKTSVEDLAE